jgi:hypothetical protein
MNVKSLIIAATTIVTALAFTRSWAADTKAKPVRPKPLKVLMMGHSQCSLIVNNQLMENLAKANKDGQGIEITGCVKSGATLKSHWDTGTGPRPAREMIAGGRSDFVVLQEIYNFNEENIRPAAVLFHDVLKKTGAQTVLFDTASIPSSAGLAALADMPAEAAKALQ